VVGDERHDDRDDRGSVFVSSLRFQVALGAVLLILSISALIGYTVIRHERKALTNEVVLRVISQARNIAASSERTLLDLDPELNLMTLVRETMSRDTDVKSIVIVDADETVLAHPDVTKVNKPRAYSVDTTPLVDFDFLQPGESVEEYDNVIVVGAPITRPFEGEIQNLGRVYIEFSKRKISNDLTVATVQVLIITGLVCALGITAAIILSGFITRPILRVAAGAESIGAGDFDVAVSVRSRNEIGRLAGEVNRMAANLKKARTELVVKERMDKELEIAREIQASLWPKRLPDNDYIQVAGACESASEVGGDYYDVIDLGGGRIGLIVADVSGKGVPGLLVMGVGRSVIRSHAREIISPREVLIRSNEAISADIRSGMFITAFYGIVDPTYETFTFANAGHNPLVLINRTDGEKKYEVSKGLGRPLGLAAGPFFDDRIEEMKTDLSPGDALVIYSDGITEAMNGNDEEYGMDRFVELLIETPWTSAGELISIVLGDVKLFAGGAPQSDDITILAATVKGRP
jgi:sigma-B regulation protein RsbU (phosphoserine phosphatase)